MTAIIPDTPPPLVRLYRKLLPAVVVYAFVVFGLAAPSPFMLVVALPLFCLGWWYAQRFGDGRLPRPISVGLIMLAVSWAVVRAAGLRGRDMSQVVDVFAEFLALLLVVRSMDRRTPRELAQVVVLAGFVLIATVLTNIELVVALAIVGAIPLLYAVALLHQVVAAYEKQRFLARRHREGVLRVEGDRRSVAAPLPAGGAAPANRAVLLFVLFATLASAVIASGVFVVMPRSVGVGPLASWGAASGRTSGLAQDIRLGFDTGTISQDSAVIADVRLADVAGRSLPTGETLYLRASVLTEYADGRWSAPERREVRDSGRSLREGLRLIDPDTPPRAERRLEISLRAVETNQMLLSPWQPERITSEARGSVQADARTLTLRWTGRSARADYAVDYHRPLPVDELPVRWAQTPGADEPPPPTEPERSTLLPESIRAYFDERIGMPPALLEPGRFEGQVRARSIARRIESHLRTEFGYTLELETAPADRDPMEWFLNDRRVGHCEYFASAMTALCWSVGLNARVVIGFVGTEVNAVTSRYVIRNSNAHAWVEVEVAPGLWETYDPTPPEEFQAIHRPPAGALDWLRRWIEAVEYAYARRVVGFDEQQRSGLLGIPEDTHPLAWLRGAAAWVQASVSGDMLRRFAMIFASLLAASAVLVAGLRVIPGARRWIDRVAGRTVAGVMGLLGARRAGPEAEDRRLHAELTQALRKLGLVKPEPVPLGRWLESPVGAPAADPAAISEARVVAEAVYLIRFAGHSLTAEQRERCRAALARMRAAAGPTGRPSAR